MNASPRSAPRTRADPGPVRSAWIYGRLVAWPRHAHLPAGTRRQLAGVVNCVRPGTPRAAHFADAWSNPHGDRWKARADDRPKPGFCPPAGPAWRRMDASASMPLARRLAFPMAGARLKVPRGASPTRAARHCRAGGSCESRRGSAAGALRLPGYAAPADHCGRCCRALRLLVLRQASPHGKMAKGAPHPNWH